MYEMKIEQVIGREILDSRGNPTVEAEVVLLDGSRGRAAAPSGASTGQYEAWELRDQEPGRYGGKGVTKAVWNINTVLREALADLDASNSREIDRVMREADGTEEKSILGANAVLAVSLACAKAAACSLRLPLYRFLGGIAGNTLPVPMMNILNGGAHAGNTIDIQEFMILPVGAGSFREGLRWCSEVYHRLGRLLDGRGFSCGVGDEGGYAPNLASAQEALDWILKAIEVAGYRPGQDFMLALDAAASEWKGERCGQYLLPKAKTEMSSSELIQEWKLLCGNYPIASLEDGLDEEDWEGWEQLTRELGASVQLVGDDLFVTNPKRLQKGMIRQCANAVLVKPNQIGTLTETMQTVMLAKQYGYAAVMSHRSGETADTTIADLAVAWNTGQIKTGAPCRAERTEKYNRLLQIEEELGDHAEYQRYPMLQNSERVPCADGRINDHRIRKIE